MAGDWIKFDKTTMDKPEVYEIAGILDIDPDAVVGKLLRVWSWFDDQSRDGHAPVTVRSLLCRVTGVTGFVDAMQSVGWMTEENGRLTLPNFARHNGTPAKSRILATVRKQKSRSCHAPSVTKTGPEKRREEKSIDYDDTTPRGKGIPTLEVLTKYSGSLPMSIKPEVAVAFFDTMEAGGWVTKQGHPIADWMAAFRRYASVWGERDKGGGFGATQQARGNNGATRPTIEQLMGGRKLSISKAITTKEENHEE